jgi:hypothetical protein
MEKGQLLYSNFKNVTCWPTFYVFSPEKNALTNSLRSVNCKLYVNQKGFIEYLRECVMLFHRIWTWIRIQIC